MSIAHGGNGTAMHLAAALLTERVITKEDRGRAAPRGRPLPQRPPLGVRCTGPGYTLLPRDAGVNVDPLLHAAAARGLPIQLPDAEPRDGWPTPHRHRLLRVRADTHVVWRGDALPLAAEAVVRRSCGVP